MTISCEKVYILTYDSPDNCDNIYAISNLSNSKIYTMQFPYFLHENNYYSFKPISFFYNKYLTKKIICNKSDELYMDYMTNIFDKIFNLYDIVYSQYTNTHEIIKIDKIYVDGTLMNNLKKKSNICDTFDYDMKRIINFYIDNELASYKTSDKIKKLIIPQYSINQKANKNPQLEGLAGLTGLLGLIGISGFGGLGGLTNSSKIPQIVSATAPVIPTGVFSIIPTMSITISTNGTYYISFSAEAILQNADPLFANITYCIFSDATQIIDSIRQINSVENDTAIRLYPISTQTVLTITAPVTITAQFLSTYPLGSQISLRNLVVF